MGRQNGKVGGDWPGWSGWGLLPGAEKVQYHRESSASIRPVINLLYEHSIALSCKYEYGIKDR